MRHRFLTRPLSAALLALTLVGTLFAAATSGSPPGPAAAATAHPDRGHHPHGPGPKDRPTVVLVHGAFAGSSGWEAVATQLMDQGYPASRSPTRCATRSATAPLSARWSTWRRTHWTRARTWARRTSSGAATPR